MHLCEGLKLRRLGRKNMIVRDNGTATDMTDVFTLNGTAADVWNGFAGREFSVEDVADYLTENYEVAKDVALRDSESLLTDWVKMGLAED